MGGDAADDGVLVFEGGEELRGGVVVADGVDCYVGVRGEVGCGGEAGEDGDLEGGVEEGGEDVFA